MIDLHMHTIYSDGSKTVEEVLKMCEAYVNRYKKLGTFKKFRNC